MNAFDVLFSLAILILIGIYGIYWHEARRRPGGEEGAGGPARAGGADPEPAREAGDPCVQDSTPGAEE